MNLALTNGLKPIPIQMLQKNNNIQTAKAHSYSISTKNNIQIHQCYFKERAKAHSYSNFTNKQKKKTIRYLYQY
jgi:hypothetical protein